MALPVSDSGEMSQVSSPGAAHRKDMAPASALVPGIDHAARRGRATYEQLSMSAVGLEMGLSVIIGAFGGRWLDGQLGTAPWIMIAGVVVGFAAGLRGAMRAMKRSDKIAAREAGDRP
jgi:F0F1-type ATP synthase assembly protein I